MFPSPRFPPHGLRIAVLLFAGLGLGCDRKTSDPKERPSERTARGVGSDPASPFAPGAGADSANAANAANANFSRSSADDTSVLFDLADQFERCTAGYQGVLLDLGDPSTRASWIRTPRAPALETVEREGASWVRIPDKTMALSFVARESDVDAQKAANPVVTARIRGGSARGVAVFLNGKPVGSWSLSRDEVRVVSAKGGPASLEWGTNELYMRFMGGGAKGRADELPAEIDWVHVGTDEMDATFAAPTRGDIFMNKSLGTESKRGVALRTPGFVRCGLFVPPGARFEAHVALVGPGSGHAELRVQKDRAAPVTLAKARVDSKTKEWVRLSAEASDVGSAGSVGWVEVVAQGAPKGSRILFGDVRLVVPRSEVSRAAPPPLPNVLVIALGFLSRNQLAVYGGPRTTPHLSELVNGGIVFTNHFGTSSFANGSMASLLTGVGPMQHGVSDGDARLPKSVTTLAEAARQGGIRAGFFTANPTTGPDFGFQREWDTFRWLPPRDDAPATTVFDEAIRFIEEHAQDRWLTVIHTRGAHPPWDVTAEARKALPPENYLGPIDPKHGAEFVVSRSRRSGAKLSDADQTRLLALENNSILLEDAALGRLLDALATKHLTDNTAILITSDVAPLHGQSVPYAETPPTDAQALLLPLMVRLPKSLGLSQRTDTLTSTVDLAPTILRLLGMDSPPQFEGTALFSPAVHTQALLGRPALAVGGERFVLRLGPFALFGPSGRDSRLCDMNLEPACVADVSSTHPIALEVLRRALFDARHRDGKTPTREPATISPETAAALRAWGR